MDLKLIEEIKSLQGPVSIEKIEDYLKRLIQLIDENSDLFKSNGAELINDLIYLKEKETNLSAEISLNVLEWIRRNYRPNPIEYLDTILEIIPLLNSGQELIFLEEKIKTAEPDIERHLLNECVGLIRYLGEEKEKVPIEGKEEVFKKVNAFFQKEFDSGEMVNLLIANSIAEYDLCYLVGWCIKDELYKSPQKKSIHVGAGPLLISKISDHIEMSGSGSGDDFIEKFELKCQGLESYWYLEIEYNKHKISALKPLFECRTSELLKKVDDGKITLEGESNELGRLQESLDTAES